LKLQRLTAPRKWIPARRIRRVRGVVGYLRAARRSKYNVWGVYFNLILRVHIRMEDASLVIRRGLVSHLQRGITLRLEYHRYATD